MVVRNRRCESSRLHHATKNLHGCKVHFQQRMVTHGANSGLWKRRRTSSISNAPTEEAHVMGQSKVATKFTFCAALHM
jgi:hypothetical protein